MVTQSSHLRKAMREADGVLLLLDAPATPFSRIWCDFEVYVTICDEKPLDISALCTKGGKREPHLLTQGYLDGEHGKEHGFAKLRREQDFPLAVLAVGMQARLEDGRASVQSDKDAILSFMADGKKEGQEGYHEALSEALEKANAKFHSYLAKAAWPQALRNGSVENFCPEGTLALPIVLSSDEDMKSLQMSFALVTEMTDSALKSIARGIPCNLKELELSFEGCAKITDEGVAALAQKLPPNLKILRLSFVSCKQITDHGLTSLAKKLPMNLQDLRLDFALRAFGSEWY